MALETLREIKEIGGFEVVRGTPNDLTRDIYDKVKNIFFIHLNDKENIISFKIQDGPIKENGVNGCQVDELIETAKIMIEGLNKKLPCTENKIAEAKLLEALYWLQKRKEDREKRGVEGQNKI